jgi:hypothetical protein
MLSQPAQKQFFYITGVSTDKLWKEKDNHDKLAYPSTKKEKVSTSLHLLIYARASA